MILPSRHISEEQALLGVGAAILRQLARPQTIASLWDRVREDRAVGTYERFVLALGLLHITGVIKLSKGMIIREAS